MTPDSTRYRYERKFVLLESDERDVEMLMRLHPARFSEIYAARYINNVYFDTLAGDNYLDNVAGTDQRLKCRVRWYGELFGEVESPTLEFKIKRGLVGTKQQFALSPFRWERASKIGIVEKSFLTSALPANVLLYLRTVEPTLLNRYRRRYFESQSKAFRLTIDTDLSFQTVGRRNSTVVNKAYQDGGLVVELKYDRQDEEQASDITKYFGFRVMKNSKYVHGLEMLNGF